MVDKMIPKSEKRLILLDSVPFVIAYVTLFYVAGLESVFAIPILMVCFLIVFCFDYKMFESANEKRENVSFASLLGVLYTNITANAMPFSASLASALQKSTSEAREALSEIVRRNSLGQDFSTAFQQCNKPKNKKVNNALSILEKEYKAKIEIRHSLKSAANAINADALLDREKAAGALNKYVILGMVCSTILPSLATFGFVGYSILYPPTEILLPFSMLLLVVFPASYLIVRAKISEIDA